VGKDQRYREGRGEVGERGIQDEAETKLQELRSASDDAWEDLKTGAENVWTEIKAAFQSAASRFK